MKNKFKRKAKKRKHSGGKPTLWKDSHVDQAFVACSEMGATEKQLAKLFKTNTMTIHVWKKKYPEFADSVRKGKDMFDTANVEDNLLRRAMGYKYKEKTVEWGLEGVKRKIITKYAAPDITAIIFWLKNRQPSRWRDFKAIAISGDKENPLVGKVESEMTLSEATKIYMNLLRPQVRNDRFPTTSNN